MSILWLSKLCPPYLGADSSPACVEVRVAPCTDVRGYLAYVPNVHLQFFLLKCFLPYQQDVDLVVLTDVYSCTETLKAIIVQEDSDFFLRNSRKIGATYKILYCRLDSFKECKVDVLVPGIMNIPCIPNDKVKHYTYHGKRISAMPAIPLLLLKLQALEDHRASDRSVVRNKQCADIADIVQLVERVAQNGCRLDADSGWLPTRFVNEGNRRYHLFVHLLKIIRHSDAWERIGFRNQQAVVGSFASYHNLFGEYV